MHLIQDKLALIAQEWNTHRIQKSSNNPGGVPDILYFLPEQFGWYTLVAV